QTRLVGGGHVHDRTLNGAGELPSGAFGNRTAGAAHGLPVEGGRVLRRTFNEARGDFVRRLPDLGQLDRVDLELVGDPGNRDSTRLGHTQLRQHLDGSEGDTVNLMV